MGLEILFLILNIIFLNDFSFGIWKGNSQLLSLLHSTSISILSIIYLTYDNYIFNIEKLKDNNLKDEIIVTYIHTFMISYCIIDLSYNYIYKSQISKASIFHHISVTIGLILTIYLEIIKYSIIYFPIELSTIFLNLRSVYENKKTLYSILFVITFILTRLIYLPYIIYISWMYIITDISTKFIFVCFAIPLQLLNIYWFYLIVNKYRKKYLNHTTYTRLYLNKKII